MATATQQNGRISLGDYIDVAERIANFNERYPDGSLQTICWTVEEIGGHTFVVYRAAAYRTPDDERPGMGIAWEPFPGKTSFTRDSELMNAETSAWGRAIVACGLTSNRKIASREEVQARQSEGNGTVQPTAEPAKPSERPASAAQRRMLNGKAAEAGLSPERFANIILTAAGESPREWEDEDAATHMLGRLIDRLPQSLVPPVLHAITKA